ncbi:MAG: Hsp70 family protein [Polyangiales bacterium]
MTNPIAVGIDLGTTNSVVAVAQGGQPRVLTTPEGVGLIPSVVSFAANGQTLVGAPARAARTVDPENTVFSVKRLMGRPFDSEEVRRAAARFAFQLERGPDQSVLVRTRAGTHTLPELSALVLREVRRVAEAALGQPIGRAVITVPANFNELQRSATKLAGQIAEIDVARILNEPTAAALAYGYGRGTRERIAVFDFGGGTFDVTLLELSGNVFEVLATAGDTFLGGDDIDIALAEGLADGASKALRFDARKDRRAYELLRAAAEQAKIDLSTLESAQIKVPNIAQGPGGRALEFRSRIARSEFEKVAQPFVQRTIDVCAEALKLAGLRPNDFAAVILVGGSSQIPLVRRAVRDFFRSEPHTSLPPDTVVGMGAAVLAEALGGKRTKITGQTRASKSPSGAPPSASQNAPASPSQAPMSAAVAGPIPAPPLAPHVSLSDAAMPAVRPPQQPLAPPPPPPPPMMGGADLPAVSVSSAALPAVAGPRPAGRAPINRGAPAAPPPPPPVAIASSEPTNASVTGLPALKATGRGVGGAMAPPPPPPPPPLPPMAPDFGAHSVSDLPALKGAGLPAVPKGGPIPSTLSTDGLPAVKINESVAALPAVALPSGAPAVRPRTSTEPHGVTKPSSPSDHAMPAVRQEPAPPSAGAPMPAPRMRTRTITHASAAVPPPAPLPPPGAALPGAPPASSIVPPKPGDLSWASSQSQPSISVNPSSIVPLDDDDGVDLPSIPRSTGKSIPVGPELDDAFGDEPTAMHSGALLSGALAAKTVPNIASSTDLPMLSQKVESKIPTLTSVDASSVEIPDRFKAPQGSHIPTQPSIGPNVLGSMKGAADAPPEGVTTLKRISTLIEDADEPDLPVPSAPKAAPIFGGQAISVPTPPVPQPPPAPAGPSVNPMAAGRRTAVMAAAPPPPPPPMPSAAMAPPFPPIGAAPPLPPAPPPIAYAPDPQFGDPSLLTSMKGLSDTDLGFDAPLPPPPPPVPPAITTAPMGTVTAPSAVPNSAGHYAPPAWNQPPMPAPPMPMPQAPQVSQAMPPLVTPQQPPPAPSVRMQAPLLLDVTPQSLRVETVGGLSQLVIARNSTIPLEQTREFATAYDNQQDVRIRIAQGEQAKFGENQPLGELELTGLRPAPRGDVKIAVTFELDADGTLRVRAEDMLTGAQTTARINLLTMPGGNAQASAMAARQRGA